MRGTTERVELVRTCTQERGEERLFYGIGVDSGRSKRCRPYAPTGVKRHDDDES